MVQKNPLENWKTTKPGTLPINWTYAETVVGFKLHKNFKDLYSRTLINDERKKLLKGMMKFSPEEFVKEYISSKEDWFENANGRKASCRFTLRPIIYSGTNYMCLFVKEAFWGVWTGGNDFGRRAYIGNISLDIGHISIIFNNNTGKFEWVDFGYRYFEIYEENPFGIIADTTQEFLNKFQLI